ncbi:hypothetical protein F0U44_10555 [Nocardioides humilatus]|uniref:Phosphatidate cytidylyltransferase n=1 Tax=Nocardioides humilatus TaxID=2607660 RepID=A0A5B1LGX4_9ACTN|nr:hypothetical protein [Nocardioides humilatus]KAA1418909.1 hypothetical protein F0U44_10555 [Nocardioides humilatus]
MSVIEHYRVSRWHDRFPPRGAWRALGGLIAFVLLSTRDLTGAVAVLVAFAAAEVIYDVAERDQ